MNLTNEEQRAKEYLDKLRKNHQFRVQTFKDFPCPWVYYEPESENFKGYIEQYGFPNHREILREEVVIDVDAETFEDAKRHSILVERKLRERNLAYKKYLSGGDGIHIHLMFKNLPTLAVDDYFVSRIKYVLIEFLLGKDVLRPEGINSHICMANKKLIQTEYGKHRKGGVKELVCGDLKENDFPEDFKEYFTDWLIKRVNMQKKAETVKEPNNLNCIKYILGKTVNGRNYFEKRRVNYRALFLLTAYYTRKYTKTNTVIKKLNEWYDSLSEHMKKASIKTVNKKQIEICAKNNNGAAGCMYRRDLLEELQETIVCEGCPYNNIVTEE